MAKTLTASEGMTDGQIETAVGQLRDAMRKHREEVGKGPAQLALGVENLGMRMFVVFRELAEKLGGFIVRHVRVNRSLTPEQIIDQTGRAPWYIDNQVLAEMPREGFEEGEVVFFELDYYPSIDELDREYEIRNLRPDPYAVAQAVTDDPAFADERPVAVQWRDKRKRACYAVFNRHEGRRKVSVHWHDNRWHRSFRFGGIRK